MALPPAKALLPDCTLPHRRGPSRLGLAAAVIAAAALLAGCSGSEEGTAKADATGGTPAVVAQPVRVVKVAMRPEVNAASYTGVIRPRYETDLAFRVGGKIVERLVDVGQRVEAGQPIARLDDADLELAMAADGAEQAAARSALAKAEADVGRYQALFDRAFVAKSALDDAVTARDEARARLERATHALDLARNRLGYAVLTAGHAGVVAGLSAEVGQVVAAGQTVATLSRLDALDAVIAVPEQKVDAIRKASAAIDLWGAEGTRYPVTLREIAPDADPTTRTYEARFTIAAADPALTLGRTVTLHLEGRSDAAVAEVPLGAVFNDGRGAAVFVLSADGTAVRRAPVELRSLSEATATVAGGIADGQTIVALGVHKLDPALPVRVVEEVLSRLQAAAN